MKNLRVTKGTYYYTPSKYLDTTQLQVVFRSLSYTESLSLYPLIEDNQENLFAYQVCRTAIIDVITVTGTTVSIDTLSPLDIKEIANKIIEVSYVQTEESSKLTSSIDVAFTEKLQTESWKCDYCQEKGLDKVRNCGYLSEDQHSDDFTLQVGGNTYKKCPIYYVDDDLLSSALESYRLYENKQLPDEGGLYDQTHFFVLASKLVDNKIKENTVNKLKKHEKE